MAAACPSCGCVAPHPAHAVLAALRADDLDAALTLGLLDTQSCPACDAACTATQFAARDARRVALAARDRYRAREARLARRKAARDAARAVTPLPAAKAPALPTAAADVLARALAKAAARKP